MSAYNEPDETHVRPSRVAVAVPIKDEAERLPACLAALGAQTGSDGQPLDPGTYGLVLLINNTRDASARIASNIAQSLACAVQVVELTLPAHQSHAGGARRAALDRAAQWLAGGPGAVLMTTDADSRVPPDWVARNLAAIEAGADAVAGSLAIDPREEAVFPEALRRRGAQEARYEQLLLRLRAMLDPQAHDPWPFHDTASGASLAVTLAAYHAIGGLPSVPLGEDKALVATLKAHGFKVRHDPTIRVITSGRLIGRAPGGTADTLRTRSVDPKAPCDVMLERAGTAFRRTMWRARMRRAYLGGWPVIDERAGRGLGLATSLADHDKARVPFEQLWASIEAASPRLQRIAMAPQKLPLETTKLRVLLAGLQVAQRLKRATKHRAGTDRSDLAEPPLHGVRSPG